MPFDQRYILVYGKYELLLGTRKQILERAGYAVLCTWDERVVKERLARGNVSVFVLCHSLTMKDVDEVLKFYNAIESIAAVLCMSLCNRQLSLDGDQVYLAHNGPAAFIEAVGKLKNSTHVHVPI